MCKFVVLPAGTFYALGCAKPDNGNTPVALTNNCITPVVLTNSQATEDGQSLPVASDKEMEEPPREVHLDLSGTIVTESRLKEIAKLKNVAGLVLYDTQLNDAGLKEIAKLDDLTQLDVGRTEVTDAGLKELRKALPKCSIPRR